MTEPAAESVRLARATWDAATPGSRVFLFLRSRYANKSGIPAGEMGVPFMAWDELPPGIALEIAWDVQFLRRVFGDGAKALKAATGDSGASVVPLRATA